MRRSRWILSCAAAAIAAIATWWFADRGSDGATSVADLHSDGAAVPSALPARIAPDAAEALHSEGDRRPAAAPAAAPDAPAARVRALIRGTARNRAGIPIDPFDVALQLEGERSPPCASDGQGRFVLATAPLPCDAELTATLQFRACGYALLERELRIRGGERAEIEVVLDPATDGVTGRVVDPHGKPLGGAEVTVRSANVSAALEIVRTDEDGRFAVRCLRSADVVSMRVSHAGHADCTLDRDAVGGQWSAVAVRMQPGCVLPGTVLDGDGRAIAGVRVQVLAADARSGEPVRLRAAAVSDVRGEFELAGLPAEPIELRFLRPGASDDDACLAQPLQLAPGRARPQTFVLPATPP